MTSLLSDAIRAAVTERSVFRGSQSFGVVALVVLVALLIEHQVLSLHPGRRVPMLWVLAEPLLAVFVLVAVVRISALLG